MVVLGGVFIAVCFLLKLPLRRQERASLFLDLLESGFQMSRRAEDSVISFSQSRDASMGVRFHLLAAYLETGVSLGQGLAKVPHLLPPRLTAMLKTGEQIGDMRQVVPLCRRMLRDSISQTQGAINYLILLAFVFTPLFPLPLVALRIFVLPKWREVLAGLAMGKLPPLSEFVFGDSSWFVSLQLTITALLYVCAILYIAGPRFALWLKKDMGIVWADKLAFRIPWKRKRMQRDFAGMLGFLLDAEVPEARALELAAQSTANEVFVRKARVSISALSRGKNFNDVIGVFDDTGELVWRVRNGSRGNAGFGEALNGWLNTLDAKAYRSEQANAQMVTTGLVLLNGLMIGLVVTGIFQALTTLLGQAVLW